MNQFFYDPDFHGVDWPAQYQKYRSWALSASTSPDFADVVNLMLGELNASHTGGRYRPQPVRRVEIPKPGGGKRTLGIPTAMDRMIQQALLQVLQPLFDPHVSDASFGFRPGRTPL